MRTPPAESEAVGSNASHLSTDGLPNSVTTQRPGEVGVEEVLGIEREGDMTRSGHEREVVDNRIVTGDKQHSTKDEAATLVCKSAALVRYDCQECTISCRAKLYF